MDDLISRQAVKELAHNQVREKYCGMALKELRDFYIKLADSIIDLLPSAQPEQRWILCSERLPEERHYDDIDDVDPSDSVLVFTRYKTYYISRYWGHRTSKGESNYVIPDWMDLDEYISDAVVAWMPLP